MSHWGRISWFVCFISFAILMGCRFILGGWNHVLFFPMGLFIGSLVLAIGSDFKFYLDFFTRRNTKHGLNMGVLVLLFLAALVAINVISLRHNLSWDLTKEKVNSLTDTTLDILRSLDRDMQITVFYSGIEAQESRFNAKELTKKYQSQSPRVKVEFVDSYVHKLRANEYLGGVQISGLTAFVEWKRGPDGNEKSKGGFGQEQKVEISAPIDEEKITSAIIRVMREKRKKIYFLTGHEERSIYETEGRGLSSLAEALMKMSFEVEELNLFDSKIVPLDADALVIGGPQSPYILSEREVIEKFLRRGGGLMMAVDTNQEHQMGSWLREWGVHFKNNLVVSPFVVISGRGQTATAGRVYDEIHEVTRKFNSNSLTIFDWAGELEVLDKSPFEITQLIKTDEKALGVSLTEGADSVDAKAEGGKERLLAIGLKGQYPGELPSKDSSSSPSREVRILVFGDSDFLSNKDIIHYKNMELTLNSMAYLAGEEDLLGITPKVWSDTLDKLAPYQMRGVVLTGFSIPLLMLILSVVLFYRRRHL